MKATKVDWLGAVPKHWAVDRLKWSTASCRNGIWGDEPTGAEDDIECVRVADFDRTRLVVRMSDPTMRSVTEKERLGRTLTRGNLLLEKSGGGEGQPVGVVVLYDHDQPAVCSNFVARMELAPDMDPSYWRYLHAAAYAARVTTRSINQTSGIQNLDQGSYFNELAPFPPLPEQTAIAALLDRETCKIDALVEEQRRLIELLKEKRQAVISHAVTKGLDPKAKMKPSGVEWLGDVPEHWEVTRLKFVASVQTGTAKGKDNAGRETIVVPYLRVANVQDGYIDLADVAEIEVPVADLNRYLLRKGDVLMNEGGDFDKLGRGHVWEGQIDPCIHQNHVFAVRPIGVTPEWLNLVTGSDYAQFFFMGRSKQSTNLASISSTNVMELPVTLPPPEERLAILQRVSGELLRLAALNQHARAAITLLQERRSALISAAVTGKIDARTTSWGKSADQGRFRLIVGAEIVERLAHKKTFGRVKLQKLLYLAEAEAGISELKGKYLREAAGPLDRDLIADVEARLQGHVGVEQQGGPGSPVMYRVLGTKGTYRQELAALLGDRRETLDSLIELLGELDTLQVEAAATLYAVWNDALLDGRQPTDEQIVSGVLEDWHPEKAKKFKAAELDNRLGWMRRNHLVPRGSGPRTMTGRLFP